MAMSGTAQVWKASGWKRFSSRTISTTLWRAGIPPSTSLVSGPMTWFSSSMSLAPSIGCGVPPGSMFRIYAGLSEAMRPDFERFSGKGVRACAISLPPDFRATRRGPAATGHGHSQGDPSTGFASRRA